MTEQLSAILMLSGGKDSCALAVLLKEAGINYLAVVIDNDLLSDVARSNIMKLTRALDMEVIIFRPAPSMYRQIINKGLDMEKTCSACSLLSFTFAKMVAGFFDVKRIYAGFTKYTAEAQGWEQIVEKEVDGYTLLYPFMKEYELKRIREICDKYGLEIDPTKTNCKFLKKLIDRSEDNPFTRELNLLFKDGQISQAEYDYYKAFTEPARRAKAGKNRGPGISGMDNPAGQPAKPGDDPVDPR